MLAAGILRRRFNELGMAEIIIESATGRVGEVIWVGARIFGGRCLTQRLSQYPVTQCCQGMPIFS